MRQDWATDTQIRRNFLAQSAQMTRFNAFSLLRLLLPAPSGSLVPMRPILCLPSLMIRWVRGTNTSTSLACWRLHLQPTAAYFEEAPVDRCYNPQCCERAVGQ